MKYLQDFYRPFNANGLDHRPLMINVILTSSDNQDIDYPVRGILEIRETDSRGNVIDGRFHEENQEKDGRFLPEVKVTDPMFIYDKDMNRP